MWDVQLAKSLVKNKNNLKVGQLFRKVTEYAGGGYIESNAVVTGDIYAYWISMSCNHCAEPACVKNCPTGAMQKRKEDGIVFVDPKKCIGCRYCIMSCPYGAPQYNPDTGKTGKCDLCRDLLAEGKKPACVTACPMRVLDVGPVEELRQKYGGTNYIKGMPKPSTKPSLIMKPHKNAIADKS
nr:DMSO/selenate family reductase complex B subunit [Acetonema longum]